MSKRPRLKPYYSVTELAEMAGCHRTTMWRRLSKRGHKFAGGPIALSELRLLLADLWESLELAAILERDRAQ